MKKAGILLLLIAGINSSCQKKYTCECFNPGGVFETHNISGTKHKAVKKCDEYARQYSSVPMSETSCAIR